MKSYAHLVNFGLFASPERTLLFDVNDFDETLRAPWEWDVKRLAASAVVAARQNGFDDTTATRVARAGVRSYRERIGVFAEMSPLDIYYTEVDAESALALSRTARPQAKKVLAKIKKNTSARALTKLTMTTTDGKSRIVDEPPILFHPKELELAPNARREISQEGIERLAAMLCRTGQLIPCIGHRPDPANTTVLLYDGSVDCSPPAPA